MAGALDKHQTMNKLVPSAPSWRQKVRGGICPHCHRRNAADRRAQQVTPNSMCCHYHGAGNLCPTSADRHQQQHTEAVAT